MSKKDIPQFERYDASDNDKGSFKPLIKKIGNGINHSVVNGFTKSHKNHFDENRNEFQISDEEIEPDDYCGAGGWHPEWLQKFASKKVFILLYACLSLVHGMEWAYFNSTISTMQKRFKISSEVTGIVMTGNEISKILFSIIIPYYGGAGHRPKWIAGGCFLCGWAALILGAHVFYGPGHDSLSLTEEYGDNRDTPTLYFNDTDFSTIYSSISDITATYGQTCRKSQDGETFDAMDCDKSDASLIPMISVFLSQFVLGIVVLTFYSIGMPYLDDNMSHKKTPLMFGVTDSILLMGPTCGFLFAGACLKVYMSPWLTPVITNSDPRWLGAYWLGWLSMGLLMVFMSTFLAMFPDVLSDKRNMKKLKTKNLTLNGMNLKANLRDANKTNSYISSTPADLKTSGGPKFSELAPTIIKLLKNKINIINALAGIFYMFAAIGYWTFMPKYMETIFKLNTTNASVIGTVALVFQSVGTVISGLVITKFLPRARVLAGLNAVLGFFFVGVYIFFIQFGCDQGNLVLGKQNVGDDTWNLMDTCNADCNCKVNNMLPVCYQEERQVFHSACHAGCNSFVNGTFSNCSCLPNPQAEVTIGTCADSGCLNTLYAFLIFSGLTKFLDSTGRIGNMLVSFRCVEAKDKALANGINISLTTIFAFLPGPILFGYIFDSACLVWGTKCGARGNCWLYDEEKLRYWYNSAAAFFILLGAILDAVVWYLVKDLDLYGEVENITDKKKERIKS